RHSYKTNKYLNLFSLLEIFFVVLIYFRFAIIEIIFMKIDLIAGARPNFVKITSIVDAIRKSSHPISFRLIHTGQHYDAALSDIFFQQLDLPQPDINLNIGSGSQAGQTAAIMVAYEKALLFEKPDICLVVGDVTSSMACAI